MRGLRGAQLQREEKRGIGKRLVDLEQAKVDPQSSLVQKKYSKVNYFSYSVQYLVPQYFEQVTSMVHRSPVQFKKGARLPYSLNSATLNASVM